MLWQLVNFKIKTTFRRSAIIAYVVVFLILLLSSLSNTHPSSSAILDIAGIVFLSSTFLTSSIYSSFFIPKSDVDFLYMLPLDEKEIEIANSLSAFLINLWITLLGAFLLLPAVSYLSVLVILMISFMNSFSFFAFKGKRKIIALIITVWMLSSILKFPFSPLSMIFGYIYGYFVLTLLDVITLILGIRNASVEDLILEFYKRQGFLTKPITSISLYSSSPFVAMLKRELNFVEIGGRFYLGGVIPYFIDKRVKIYKVVAITSAVAVVIGILPYIVGSTTESTNILSAAYGGLMALFAGFFIIWYTSRIAFVNEPLWLNLSVMTPMEFARKYLLTKTLSVFIVFLPISISLLLLNTWFGFGSLLVPLIYIYAASLNARFYPEQMSNAPFYDTRILSADLLSAIPILFLVIFDTFVPIPLGVPFTLALTLPFLFSKGYWEKTFEKAITSV